MSPSPERGAAADSLVMMRNYFGNVFNGFVPNDNDLAISNHDEVCSVTNTTIMTKDQMNGIQYGAFTLHIISQSLGLQNEEFDPKVIYDPNADRFVMVCLNGFTDSTSNIVLGFSQDSSSYGSWQFYALPGNPLNNSLWTDFPMIAVNDNYLFLTVNLLYNDSTWQAGFNETLIWQIDLTEGYSGSTLNPTLHFDIHHNGEPIRNICPVKGGSGNYGPDFYFLSNRNFAASNDTVFLVTMPPGPNPTPTVTPVVANTGYHMPLNATQPWPTPVTKLLQVNDARFLGAFYENGKIQGVASTLDTTSGHDGIYHVTIDNISTSPTADSEIIVQAPYDIAYPNIAYAGTSVSSDAAVISVLKSSDTEYPGCGAIYFDDNGTYSQIRNVKEGLSYTLMLNSPVERWGDYTGCQTRYNWPGVVWMNGSYTVVNHTTRTWIAELAPSIISSDYQITEKPVEFTVFPNPVAEKVSLDFSLQEDGYIEITLTNVNGRLVERLYHGSIISGDNTFTFTVEPLPAGVYMLNIIDGSGNVLGSEKIVKN